jgi:hypothetical protein
MQRNAIQDYGIPVERAAQISGWERGAFRTLLFQGLFGPAPTPPISRAPLLHVAAATALKEAENAGVPRENVLPVLQHVADSIYVRMAIDELRDMRWHLATCGTTLTSRLRSGDCQSEIEELLGVETRNSKPFAVFPPTGAMLLDMLPDASAVEFGAVCLSMGRIAEQIRARVPDPLFH